MKDALVNSGRVTGGGDGTRPVVLSSQAPAAAERRSGAQKKERYPAP